MMQKAPILPLATIVINKPIVASAAAAHLRLIQMQVQRAQLRRTLNKQQHLVILTSGIVESCHVHTAFGVHSPSIIVSVTLGKEPAHPTTGGKTSGERSRSRSREREEERNESAPASIAASSSSSAWNQPARQLPATAVAPSSFSSSVQTSHSPHPPPRDLKLSAYRVAFSSINRGDGIEAAGGNFSFFRSREAAIAYTYEQAKFVFIAHESNGEQNEKQKDTSEYETDQDGELLESNEGRYFFLIDIIPSVELASQQNVFARKCFCGSAIAYNDITCTIHSFIWLVNVRQRDGIRCQRG